VISETRLCLLASSFISTANPPKPRVLCFCAIRGSVENKGDHLRGRAEVCPVGGAAVPRVPATHAVPAAFSARHSFSHEPPLQRLPGAPARGSTFRGRQAHTFRVPSYPSFRLGTLDCGTGELSLLYQALLFTYRPNLFESVTLHVFIVGLINQ